MVDQNLNHNSEQLWYSEKIRRRLDSGFRQVFGSIFERNIMVGRLFLEELRFAFQRVAHAFFGVDVLLTMPKKPSFNGYTRPARISSAFVLASIRSSFVSTPIVGLPSEPTERASLSDSELARSTFVGDTARTIL